MPLQKMLLAGLLVLPTLTWGASPAAKRQIKPVEILQDQKAVIDHFRALGYRAHGGVEKAMSDREQGIRRNRGVRLPSKPSSFRCE
jgi:hypothetical protein